MSRFLTSNPGHLVAIEDFCERPRSCLTLFLTNEDNIQVRKYSHDQKLFDNYDIY